jgi:hypothetical protein
MVQLFQQIPTMKATKDEVGNIMERAPQLIERTGNKLAVWSAGGGTGDQLLEKMQLGIVGLCPTPQYAELLQQVMELEWAGKKSAAFDMYARVQTFAAIPGATGYMMEARGVFPEGTKSRPQPMEPEAQRAGAPAGGDLGAAGGRAGGGGRPGGGAGAGGGGGRGGAPLTDKQKEYIRYAIDTYLKPYFRG